MGNNLQRKLNVDVVNAGKPGLFMRRVTLFPSPRKTILSMNKLLNKVFVDCGWGRVLLGELCMGQAQL